MLKLHCCSMLHGEPAATFQKSLEDSRTQPHEFLIEASSGSEDEVCAQAGVERENEHDDDDVDEERMKMKMLEVNGMRGGHIL